MTHRTATLALCGVYLLAFTHPSTAQPVSGLPAVCTQNSGHGSGGMGMGMGGNEMMMPADQAHADLMKGMAEMNMQMMSGMTASDIDVAFVCSMIPHHQGAIDMAKAELAHGDNQWAKDMAQKVIDAQEKEIAEMLAWLEEQATQ
jgi:uncharacterized protein (DUF305 family)